GHSIGVPIAVASDYSFIVPTATMTIHPVRLTGLVIGVPQTFEYLDKMQERVIQFVVTHSNVKEEKFKELMFAKGNLTRRSEEHTSELQSRFDLVCRLLLEKK